MSPVQPSRTCHSHGLPSVGSAWSTTARTGRTCRSTSVRSGALKTIRAEPTRRRGFESLAFRNRDHAADLRVCRGAVRMVPDREVRHANGSQSHRRPRPPVVCPVPRACSRRSPGRCPVVCALQHATGVPPTACQWSISGPRCGQVPGRRPSAPTPRASGPPVGTDPFDHDRAHLAITVASDPGHATGQPTG
jgi:hypothetical protein